MQSGDWERESHSFARPVGPRDSQRDNLFQIESWFFHCPNPARRQVTADIQLARGIGGFSPKPIFTSRILPRGAAKAYSPNIVPEGIIADYQEACLILDLSPKAAATRIRRAMQGLLRDFYGAKGRHLYDEITSTKDRCEPSLWAAMHAVREIGNIGAHKEKDIDVIVDVDPEEAAALKGLLELMFDETYIAKAARDAKIAKVMEIVAAKMAPPSQENPILAVE